MSFSSVKNINFKNTAKNIFVILLSASVIGALCGVIGALFVRSIEFVTEFRSENSWILYLLPIGGLVTVALYKLTKTEGIGTVRILESARGKGIVPILLLPVIFASTVITHLLGGSAGKEGAALQIGSSVSEAVSKVTRADSDKRSIYAVCGMAALFSAAFGTPFGAWIFALEVVFVKRIMMSAAIPALISSVIANLISVSLGAKPEKFEVGTIPGLDLAVSVKTLLISAIAAVVALAFCYLLHGGEKLFKKVLKNPFIRITVGGVAVIVLTIIFGTDYNGGGFGVIERIFEEGIVRPEAFLLKIIFTVITVSAGFKGGEIVPSLFIGSTLGGTLSPLLGLSPEFGAAIGMTAFFSGVTNCPLAVAVISIELFGFEGFVFFVAAAFVSRLISWKKFLYN